MARIVLVLSVESTDNDRRMRANAQGSSVGRRSITGLTSTKDFKGTLKDMDLRRHLEFDKTTKDSLMARLEVATIYPERFGMTVVSLAPLLTVVRADVFCRPMLSSCSPLPSW